MLVLRNGARRSKIPGGLDRRGRDGILTFKPSPDPADPYLVTWGLTVNARLENDAAVRHIPMMAQLCVGSNSGGLVCGLNKCKTIRKNKNSGGSRRATTNPAL